jgi:putative ABC transport system ATP-binding protein
MIRLDHLNRIFEVGDEKVHALADVDLNVEAGEYLSIMGPSGSGKSTLLNILGLLDRPSSGTYHLDDVDSSSLSDEDRARLRRNKIGFVFQFFHLIPRLTAFENVELPLTLAGVEPEDRRPKVEAALESLGLTPRAGHRPDQLSGGQRQRVAIARATIMDPPVLLADEPTGNLDSASAEEVIEILEGLNERGITLLVVTHDEALGKRAKRRIHMVDGAIVEDRRQTPS